MPTELDKIKDELLALPIQSRASLAQSLIESLDEFIDPDVDTAEIDAAWSKRFAAGTPRLGMALPSASLPTRSSQKPANGCDARNKLSRSCRKGDELDRGLLRVSPKWAGRSIPRRC